MGSVADRIARNIVASRKSKVVDLAGWREGKATAREAGFTGNPARDSLAHLDPCHATYVMANNFTSVVCDSVSAMREARNFVRIVAGAEEEYLPSGPPMSPLTVSYFAMWSLFDVRFGRSRETMGSCVLRIFAEFDDCPPWLVGAVNRMQQSRMGFFVHSGSDGEAVFLREVGTREVISCTVPAGYAGCDGQIWFVRVLPPPARMCPHHIVLNTPYVIRDYPERAWADYLDRELARMKKRAPLRADDALGWLMKYGPHPNHWNEYIFTAYTDAEHDVIFLTGIPDIPESLPHGPARRG